MGANPWHYFVPYDSDINEALQKLKEEEFRAGRYGFDYWCQRMNLIMHELGAPAMPPIESWAWYQPKPSAETDMKRWQEPWECDLVGLLG